jgi:hypothetical protein
MNQSVKYRRNAAECYEAARIPTDPRQKAKLLVMADSWKSLADHAERNGHFQVARLERIERRIELADA